MNATESEALEMCRATLAALASRARANDLPPKEIAEICERTARAAEDAQKASAAQ